MKKEEEKTKKRTARGMGSIRKKNGGYEGRINITVDGRKKQVSFFNKDKRILVQEMMKAKQDAEELKFVGRNNITVEEWLKKWVQVYKKPYIKPRTLQGYIEKMKTNIIPFIGHYNLQQINRMVLQELFSNYVTGNSEKGIKQYSPKTIKEIKSILNMAFNDAEMDKIIKENPMTYVKTPRVQKVKKAPTLTIKQQQELMQILLKEENGLAYILILNTGLRPGECGGIKWKHYDYKKSWISVNDNYGSLTIYDEEFNKVKSINEEKDLKTLSSKRIIPLQTWLNELMNEYLKSQLEKKDLKNKSQINEENIFINSIGNPLNSDYLGSTFSRILKRNDFPHISVYELRHLFATRCIDVNIPINQLQQYLGHALASTTMDVYVGYDEETNRKEIQKLNEINNNIDMIDSKCIGK